jgi:ABC-type nitrate/sulfonate/bicarbonate transport system substrate-binding protein
MLLRRLVLLLVLLASPARAAELPILPITVFAAPSYSVWLPTIIQQTGIDTRLGFRLEVKQKPGQVAYAEFASGIDKVCFCAAPAAVARFVEQGADITLLWNVFNLEYVIVTADPSIRSARDLAGKRIAADTGTGGWAVASLLLRQQGLDLAKVQIQSAWGAAQVAQLVAGRVDALVTGPAEATLLESNNPPGTYHQIAVSDRTRWQEVASSPGIPSIAMGVWRDWLDDPLHRDLARRFYQANLEAVEFVRAHPDETADIISRNVRVTREHVLLTLKSYGHILNVGPIEPYAPAIRLLTQQWLPDAKLLPRPMRDDELVRFIGGLPS